MRYSCKNVLISFKVFCYVKEAGFRRLHTVWFHFCDVLGKSEPREEQIEASACQGLRRGRGEDADC